SPSRPPPAAAGRAAGRRARHEARRRRARRARQAGAGARALPAFAASSPEPRAHEGERALRGELGARAIASLAVFESAGLVLAARLIEHQRIHGLAVLAAQLEDVTHLDAARDLQSS